MLRDGNAAIPSASVAAGRMVRAAAPGGERVEVLTPPHPSQSELSVSGVGLYQVHT